MLCMVRVTVMLICLSVLGCSAETPAPVPAPAADARDAVPDDTADGATGAFALDLPQNMLAGITKHEAASPLLERKGSEFIPGQAQLVAADGDSACFTPGWADNTSAFSTVAYGVYSFSLEGWRGYQTLKLDWDGTTDVDQVWIGLSNWVHNRWDWFPCNVSSLLEIQADRLAASIKPDTGGMLVAVLMLGCAPARLDLVRLGVPLSPWPMAYHDARHSSQSSYIGSQAGVLRWIYRASGAAFEFSDPLMGPDGTVYTGCGPDLHAFNPDGSEAWCSVNCWPCSKAARAEDGTLYLGNTMHQLVAISSDGVQLWAYQVEDQIVAPPVVGADGSVYFGSLDANVYALNPDGTLQWKYATGDAVRSTPALGTDGTIYLRSDDLNAYALSPDGELRWKYLTDMDSTIGPVVSSNDTIYLTCDNHILHAVNADGSLRWDHSTGIDFLTPIVTGTDGTMYLGTIRDDLHYLAALGLDGYLKWLCEVEAICTPACGPDGKVYIGAGPVYAIDIDGTIVAQYEADAWPGNSSMVVGQDGTVYRGHFTFFAISPENTLRWSYSSSVQLKNLVIDADGTVFTGSADGCLHAVNPDGTLKWRNHATNCAQMCPAVGFDGAIYAEINGNLCALNNDGSLRWSYTAIGAGFYSPTLGPDGTIYIVDSELGIINVLNPAGWPLWTYHPLAAGYGEPAISQDGTVCLRGQFFGLYAVNPDATLKWEYEIHPGFYPPVVDAEGTVFVADDQLLAINPDGKQEWSIGSGQFAAALGSDETLYVSGPGLSAVNPDGSQKWSFTTAGTMCSVPAIGADGTAYIGNTDCHVYAIGADGAVKWSYPTGANVEAAPVIGVDGTVYAVCGDGKLYAFGD